MSRLSRFLLLFSTCAATINVRQMHPFFITNYAEINIRVPAQDWLELPFSISLSFVGCAVVTYATEFRWKQDFYEVEIPLGSHSCVSSPLELIITTKNEIGFTVQSVSHAFSNIAAPDSTSHPDFEFEEAVTRFTLQKEDYFGEKPTEYLLSHVQKVVERHRRWDRFGDLVIDVGAAHGNVLTRLMNIFPPHHGHRFTAFEPDPHKMALLTQRIKEHGLEGYGTVVAAAVSSPEKSGTIADFHLNYDPLNYHMASSELAGFHPQENTERPPLAVPVVSLDAALLPNLNGSGVAILKIDAEGWDGMVLSGASGILNDTRLVLFECCDHLSFVGGGLWQSSIRAITLFLARHGFETFLISSAELFSLSGRCWDESYRNLGDWSNCIAIHNDDPLRSEFLSPYFPGGISPKCF